MTYIFIPKGKKKQTFPHKCLVVIMTLSHSDGLEKVAKKRA